MTCKEWNKKEKRIRWLIIPQPVQKERCWKLLRLWGGHKNLTIMAEVARHITLCGRQERYCRGTRLYKTIRSHETYSLSREAETTQ